MNLIDLQECASTNDEAWLKPEGTVVAAKRQTKGRGRQGRTWLSEDAGNILASARLRPPKMRECAAWVPLAAGVAAVTAIHTVIKNCELTGLRLKWPNDLYWEDSKIGGILCESRITGDTLSGLVVGWGLNLVSAPELEEINTSCLLKHSSFSGFSISAIRTEVIHMWAKELETWIDRLDQGKSNLLRAQWLAHAKLRFYPNLRVHDKSGTLVYLTALDLTGQGKLKATDGARIYEIDQADSV